MLSKSSQIDFIVFFADVACFRSRQLSKKPSKKPKIIDRKSVFNLENKNAIY